MSKFLTTLRINWKTGVAGMAMIAVAGGATINGSPLDAATIANFITGVGLLVAGDQK